MKHYEKQEERKMRASRQNIGKYSVDRGGSDELSFNSVLHKNYNS